MNWFQRNIIRFIAPAAFGKLKQAEDGSGAKSKRRNYKQSVSNYRRFKVEMSIDDWEAAIMRAEDTNGTRMYNRVYLYEFYHRLELDTRLVSQVEKVYNNLLMIPFGIMTEGGVADKEKKKLFEKQWFHTYIKYMLDGELWGHSLVQITDVKKVDWGYEVKELEVIPRENVRPEKGLLQIVCMIRMRIVWSIDL